MTLYRERGYFRCEYCGAFHFPNPSRDGIRLLGQAPEKLPCPVCGESLYIALLDDVYRGHQCPKCRGLLLPTAVFRDVVLRRRAAAAEPPEPPRPRNLAELERRLACPRCGQTMNTHPYYGPGNIIIDTCYTCHTLWLDPQELARVVNAPGNDRGSAHRPKTPPLRPLVTPASRRSEPEPAASLLDFLGALFD
jgi:Zn-finger nucleic acid-binding protein